MLATPLTYEGASSSRDNSSSCRTSVKVVRRARSSAPSDFDARSNIEARTPQGQVPRRTEGDRSHLALRGSQFLTEIQGGSDVGATLPSRRRMTRFPVRGGSRVRSGSARSRTQISSRWSPARWMHRPARRDSAVFSFREPRRRHAKRLSDSTPEGQARHSRTRVRRDRLRRRARLSRSAELMRGSASPSRSCSTRLDGSTPSDQRAS